MAHPNPMVDLCSLLAHGELTLAVFSEWSARHYGPVLESSHVRVLLEDFDNFLAQLSSTELSRSLRRLRPVISRLANSAQQSAEGATTDRRDALHAGKGAPTAELSNQAILAWISRYYGEPLSIEPSQVGAILADFDAVLSSGGSDETEFSRAIVRLRGVLARRAESALTAPVTIREGALAAPEGADSGGDSPRWVRSDAITFTSS